MSTSARATVLKVVKKRGRCGERSDTTNRRTKLSVMRHDLPIQEKLAEVRTELLDLSARNSLLEIPR